MLFAPDNTLQKGIYPQQMIQSLSYSFSTPHHGPEGYPCPCPMTPTSERPGCQVMPRRSWMIPDVVVEELCRTPAPACRGHHVLTSLQDQTFQCKSTLIVLPAFQFCFICGWFIPVSSLGGIFLCTRQASVFQGYFTHGKWCFCCFPKRLSPKKKSSIFILHWDHRPDLQSWKCVLTLSFLSEAALSICRKGKTVFAILPCCQLTTSHINVMTAVQFIFVKPWYNVKHSTSAED